MPKAKWELRIRGYVSSGDTYSTWYAAYDALYKVLNRVAFEASRAGNVLEAEEYRRACSWLAGAGHLLKRECPRSNISLAPCGRSFQVNRIP